MCCIHFYLHRRFERSELIKGSMMASRPITMSTATNTKSRKIKSKFEEEKLSPTETQSIEEHEKSISEIIEDSNNPTMLSQTDSMQKSTTSATSKEIKESKSFVGSILEFANDVLSVAMFIKYVLTSRKYRNIAVKIIKMTYTILHSPLAQHVAEFIVDVAGKFITLTTYVHEANGMTKVSLEILPAIERL